MEFRLSEDIVIALGYDGSIQKWTKSQLIDNIEVKEKMKKMELYSFQLEEYDNTLYEKKKKKRKGGK